MDCGVCIGTEDVVPDPGESAREFCGQRGWRRIISVFLDTDIDDISHSFVLHRENALVFQQGDRPISNLLDDGKVGPSSDKRVDPVLIHQPVLVQPQAGLQDKHLQQRVVDAGFRDSSGCHRFGHAFDHSYRILGFKEEIMPGF